MSVLASCYLDCAQYADAAATALEAAEHAVRDGLAARFGVGLLRHAAVALIALGRWDEADALLDRAQQYYPSLQEVDIEGCLLTARGPAWRRLVGNPPRCPRWNR